MRIIAGEARGRKFDAPEGMDTRPTLDRVKESVFGSIQFEIYGRNVLDLFAGSGNLGLESLSRGAESCLFCDMSKNCFDIISNNVRSLGFAGKSKVVCMPFDTLLTTLKNKKFDLVFLDPPYATGYVQKAHEMLCNLDLLSPDAVVVAEHSKEQVLDVHEDMLVRSEKTYRDTQITILQKKVLQ